MGSIDEKTFVLGIGAQKAGTSWLFHYLESRSDFFMSPIKELHWFDTKYREELHSHFNNRFIERVVDPVKRGDFRRKTPMGKALLDRLGMICGDVGYREFFESRVPETCDYFGEVSPSYALLPVEGFQEIRKLFPKIKIVYLLRDPVDRLYSQLRMAERKGFFTSTADFFVEALGLPDIIERSVYHKSIERLETVFGADEILVGFYETFFSDEGVGQLCDFLGCDFVPGQYEKRVNSDNHTQSEGLDRAAIEAGVRVFADVYAFCRERYGDQVPESWNA